MVYSHEQTETETETETDTMAAVLSVCEQCEHLHTILHKPFFIRIGVGLGLCQCEHTIRRKWKPIYYAIAMFFYGLEE